MRPDLLPGALQQVKEVCSLSLYQYLLWVKCDVVRVTGDIQGKERIQGILSSTVWRCVPIEPFDCIV